MFIPRIYYPTSLSKNQTLSLDSEASHYVSKVLRLKENDQIFLFNGEGGEYLAQIKHLKKTIMVQLIDYQLINRESSLQIHLGHGLARADKMDWVIQKTSELGVTTITPLETQRSIIKLENDRKEKRQTHWERIAISACEQSGRTSIPLVHQPQPVKTWALQSFEGISVFFDPKSTTSIKSLKPHSHFRIAVGPESGWSDDEIQCLKNHGFIALSLGPRILRTETASVTAVSLLQGIFGDL
ncbi:MAG: 16S rRNA (uracil(1498)-N(3))-methyltransferase [Candidatus Berkiella sp.]